MGGWEHPQFPLTHPKSSWGEGAADFVLCPPAPQAVAWKRSCLRRPPAPQLDGRTPMGAETNFRGGGRDWGVLQLPLPLKALRVTRGWGGPQHSSGCLLALNPHPT